MKKILIIDDSALVRRVLSDIINADGRFIVTDVAENGEEALKLLRANEYDAAVLDVNMPKMDGIELLKKLKEENIRVKILMASTDTTAGAKITADALELGAMDFVEKPKWSYKIRKEEFGQEFLCALYAVAESKIEDFSLAKQKPVISDKAEHTHPATPGNRLVAIAVSTGGPKSLQHVIPLLPKGLNAPVVVVQHMPVGFTLSLANRMDAISNLPVSEAKEGELLQNGRVYIAMGGVHLKLLKTNEGTVVHYTDEVPREGVKPCANYMYESLSDSDYDEIICVVMTGMGADGMEGIANLKKKKKIHCITQEENSCVVYGMPKAVVRAGLSDREIELSQIAQEIISRVGVMKNGR